jgi:hypothetical protein
VYFVAVFVFSFFADRFKHSLNVGFNVFAVILRSRFVPGSVAASDYPFHS